MSKNFTQQGFWLKVKSPLGENDLLLRSFHGEDRISGLFHYQLELVSEKPDLDLTAIKLVGPTGTVAPVPDAGRANPGGLFRYDAALGGYIFNLSTKGLAAGKYTLYFQSRATRSSAR